MGGVRNASLEGSSRLRQYLFLKMATLLSRSEFARRMTKALALSIEFTEWNIERFGSPLPMLLWREDIWRRMLTEVRSRKIVVWEFGVAWGYTTKWWLDRMPSQPLLWHGFDRFTGLPRAWRNYPAGAFDAGGSPPAIEDERIRWHVGNVEDTLPSVPINRGDDEQWIILFDLDLYEPTKFAFEHLKGNLRPGDMLYFDEAIDQDERRVLDERVIGSGCPNTKLLACNPIGLALQIMP